MWQTVALIVAGTLGVVGVIYIAFRMLRKEARRGAGDKAKSDELAADLEADRLAHAAAGGPLPLSRDSQLKWLRWLAARAERRRSKALRTDDGGSDQ